MRKAVVGKEHDNFLFVIKIVFFVSSLQALKMHCSLYRSRGCLMARKLANGRCGPRWSSTSGRLACSSGLGHCQGCVGLTPEPNIRLSCVWGAGFLQFQKVAVIHLFSTCSYVSIFFSNEKYCKYFVGLTVLLISQSSDVCVAVVAWCHCSQDST